LLQVLVTNILKKNLAFISLNIHMNERRDKKRLKEIGLYIKAIRESLGLSQDDVASQCDVTKGNISMIENGKKDFAFTTFLELAKGLGKHPKKLLDKDFEFLKEE
jgi:DNA-binding XRE family transcriptional regulator